jgi:hypothetical protein
MGRQEKLAMKFLFSALIIATSALPASAKEAARAPASASVLCGIVTKVGMADGESYLMMKDWDQRQAVRVVLLLKGDGLNHALAGAHASLNSMGKVFFCTDRAATKKGPGEHTLTERTPFYTSLYDDIQ